MTKNDETLLNEILSDKSDIYICYLLCFISICTLIIGIALIDIIAIMCSIVALFFGISGLRISRKATQKLKENLKKVRQNKNERL